MKRRREANRLARTILAEYHRLGFTRRTGSTRKKNGKAQRVRFEAPLLMTADELWCPFNLRGLF